MKALQLWEGINFFSSFFGRRSGQKFSHAPLIQYSSTYQMPLWCSENCYHSFSCRDNLTIKCQWEGGSPWNLIKLNRIFLSFRERRAFSVDRARERKAIKRIHRNCFLFCQHKEKWKLVHDVKIWMGKCAVRGCVGASPTDNAAALCACSSNEILPSGTEDKVKATFNTSARWRNATYTISYLILVFMMR